MSGATRVPVTDVQRQQRDPREVSRRFAPGAYLRVISVVWASITDTDLQPGELVFNANDKSLVYREGRDTIYRFGNDAIRNI